MAISVFRASEFLRLRELHNYVYSGDSTREYAEIGHMLVNKYIIGYVKYYATPIQICLSMSFTRDVFILFIDEFQKYYQCWWRGE